MPPKPATQTTHTGPTALSGKTQYLVIYNLISLILWLGILLRFALAYFYIQASSGRYVPTSMESRYPFLDIAYPATRHVLKWTQSLALVEVLHAATGLVRTSVLTTGMQVASRLLLVWAVVHKLGQGLFVTGGSEVLAKGVDAGSGGVPGLDIIAGLSAQVTHGFTNVLASIGLGSGAALSEVQMNQAGYVGMVLAWSVTECIRYLYFIYYAGSASGKAPGWLTWLRYNTFFVLYPVGISCECFLIYRSIPFAAYLDERYALAFKVILGIYVPGSYILYTHMMAQRNKVMKGKGSAKSKTG